MARRNEEIDRVDIMIGAKIQELRIALGMSREELAKKIGVTHQQTQKYEKGKNRISVGRLVAIAEALGKPASYFFEETVGGQATRVPTHHQRMCIEVARNFMRIGKPLYQDAINVLVRILADDTDTLKTTENK